MVNIAGDRGILSQAHSVVYCLAKYDDDDGDDNDDIDDDDDDYDSIVVILLPLNVQSNSNQHTAKHNDDDDSDNDNYDDDDEMMTITTLHTRYFTHYVGRPRGQHCRRQRHSFAGAVGSLLHSQVR